jgi:hypothetical protein
VFTRRPTSADKLRIHWHYPVPAEIDAAHTGVVPSALAQIRAGDPRPLLVVRECLECKGTDNAILGDGDNERIQTMARFFRCVKLPNHVLDRRHAFHGLFAKPQWRDTPHVFLLSADAQMRIDFAVPYTLGALHDAMAKILAHDYRDDTNAAVKQLLGLLDEFDQIDDREKLLQADFDRALETEKPGSARLRKLTERLHALVEERNALLARERALSDLALK